MDLNGLKNTDYRLQTTRNRQSTHLSAPEKMQLYFVGISPRCCRLVPAHNRKIHAKEKSYFSYRYNIQGQIDPEHSFSTHDLRNRFYLKDKIAIDALELNTNLDL